MMDFRTELEWIHRELEKVQDPVIIDAIMSLLKSNIEVASERSSQEDYNREIDASIAQIDHGKTYTHGEMGERIKKWQKK